ncbi:hypothetical protein [Cupriavidus sp. 2SB]|uniref:hypothetical protein n=1 Tax=Cupriavidus sp. 2SB TaxID=2502199 RepID=UPI0010F5B5F9|nr:hypothetical protein [Cupriavidus sp. 2SB]
MAQPPLSLSELAAHWPVKRHPDAITARQMRHVTDCLSVISAVTDPCRLTPAHLEVFRADLLIHYPPHTARRMLDLIQALLQFGVSETLLTANPTRGMAIRPSPAPAVTTSYPFAPDDLTRIFRHPIFTAHTLPLAPSAGGIAAYWLPLILLGTGARPGEVAALRTGDFGYSADTPPIPYWRVVDRVVKTAASQCARPIHPILCRLGLLDYVESLPAGSDLFPLLPPDHMGNRSTRFSAYLHRFLREEVGLAEPNKVAHSFRLTFAQACRQAALPADFVCALLGHPTASWRRGHGKEIPLAALQQAVARLTFAGFPL